MAANLTGCGLPSLDVSPCTSDPERGGGQCADPKGNAFFKRYDETNGYVMLSPDDAGKVLRRLEQGNKCLYEHGGTK